MEVWTIDENWRTVNQFSTLDDGEYHWQNNRKPEEIQLLYREGHYKPIRVMHSI